MAEDFNNPVNAELTAEILRVLGEVLDRYRKSLEPERVDPQGEFGDTTTAGVEQPEPIQIPAPPIPTVNQGAAFVSSTTPVAEIEPVREVPKPEQITQNQAEFIKPTLQTVNINHLSSASQNYEAPQSEQGREFPASPSVPTFVPVAPPKDFVVDQQRSDEYDRAPMELPDDFQTRMLHSQHAGYMRSYQEANAEHLEVLSADAIRARDEIRAINASYMSERI